MTIGPVTADALAYFHPDEGDYVLEAGNYTVTVAQSSDLHGAPESVKVYVPAP